MALFQTVKRVTTEYVEPVKHQRRNKPRRQQVVFIQQPVKQVKWMTKLDLLCHNDSAHPLPVKLVNIGTIPDPKVDGGFRYIYACPYGRGNGNACDMREYWVLGNNGKARRLWRGKYNGR
jgi:hypothetical protein